MKKDELKVFYLLDKRQYLVKKNPLLKKILKTLETRYSEKDIQEFIDKVISWYVVKFSDSFLNSLYNGEENIDKTLLDIMNFDKLQKSYCTFEENLFAESNRDDEKVILQKHLIIMVGWGLIYYKDSNPEYGYYRAKQLLNDFNSFYSWNLSPSIYRPVLERNYSPDNEENRKLLDKKKGKQNSEKNKTKKRRILFRR